MKASTIALLLALGPIIALVVQAAPIKQPIDKRDTEWSSPIDMNSSDMPWGKRDTEWSSPADDHAGSTDGNDGMAWDKRDTEWNSSNDIHASNMPWGKRDDRWDSAPSDQGEKPSPGDTEWGSPEDLHHVDI
ncbi:hypothetical protein BG015_006387 [Linnemannia schmuckeri]|uniref:Uncharacterized protein n=1 Tax=Linnemannia schmuckeri TaxID=64567 RepID=A0A9P5S2J0_9FUNG|nr:hypothetical protein BG015_006387 [Linnemannia schmuckeri]